MSLCYKLLFYFVFLSIKLLGSGINLGKVLQCENILHLTIFSILSFSSLVHFLTSISIKLSSIFLSLFLTFSCFFFSTISLSQFQSTSNLLAFSPQFLDSSFSLCLISPFSSFLTLSASFSLSPIRPLSFLCHSRICHSL